MLWKKGDISMAFNNNYFNPYYGMNHQQIPRMQDNMYAPYQQPVQQVSVISGRIVDKFDGINVNEVPMDGSPAVFIKSDLSEIMTKRWGTDGLINETLYKAQISNSNIDVTNLPLNGEKSKNDAFNEVTDIFNSKLTTIENTMNEILGKLSSKSTTTARGKKENVE